MFIASKRIIVACCAAGLLGLAGVGAGIAATQHTVDAIDKKFSAKKLKITVGDTISFTNSDPIKHNLTIRKLKYNSGLQQPGEKIDVLFDKQGKFKVRCGIHPKMKLTVKVE